MRIRVTESKNGNDKNGTLAHTKLDEEEIDVYGLEVDSRDRVTHIGMHN